MICVDVPQKDGLSLHPNVDDQVEKSKEYGDVIVDPC